MILQNVKKGFRWPPLLRFLQKRMSEGVAIEIPIQEASLEDVGRHQNVKTLSSLKHLKKHYHLRCLQDPNLLFPLGSGNTLSDIFMFAMYTQKLP